MFSQQTNLNISTTWFLFNLVTTHVLYLWPLLLVYRPGPLWKSLIAVFGMLHLFMERTDLREHRQIQSPSLSLITHCSSSSSPSSLSPFSSSLTRSVFHSELKTWLFGKSFPPWTFSSPTRLIPWTLGPFNVFILLNSWICLDGVLD